MTREEAGLDAGRYLKREYGSSPTTLLQAGGMTCIKIPKQYAERSRRRANQEAKEAVEGLGVVKKTDDDARRVGLKADSTVKKKVEVVKDEQRQPRLE